ncbi:MAG: arginase family protein [Bacillota bacterium]
MAIHLLGFPTTLGLPRKAGKHAPEVLRAAGLLSGLEGLGHRVVDHGDMALPEGRQADPPEVRIRRVAEAARQQCEHWLKVDPAGDLMLTVGGDHSTSLGTIWALSEMGHDFDIVWVDAHGDFNVLETSPSGNPHGMVLAMASGLCPAVVPKLISPRQLRLWGIRDLDPGERRLLEREQVEVLDPDQVRHEADRILQRLKPNLFLSFDMDAVDPAEAPGTMTPVPGGFHRGEALELVAAIARHRRLLAVDLVEYHPDRDRAGLTAALALEVAQAAVAGRAAPAKGAYDAAAGA